MQFCCSGSCLNFKTYANVLAYSLGKIYQICLWLMLMSKSWMLLDGKVNLDLLRQLWVSSKLMMKNVRIWNDLFNPRKQLELNKFCQRVNFSLYRYSWMV